MIQDMEQILFTREQIQRKVHELGKQITEDYGSTVPLLIGILKGSVPFVADLMREINIPVEFDFMAVSSYGSMAVSSGQVKILKDLDRSIEGRHVLIVEDIIDTGLTLNYLMQLMHQRQVKSVEIVTFLDKPSGRKVDLIPKYIGYEIPPGFVVGYGLDYAEKYRNFPHIGILKPQIYEK